MTILKKSLLAGLALLILAAPVAAGAADTVSIAIVDMQQLLTDSEAGKDIQKQLESRKSAFLSEISKEEQKLREDEKALSDQRASLSADDFAKKAKEFEGKLNDTRHKAQEQKKALEESTVKALGQLRDQILKITQGISDEHGYTLVVARQSVILSKDSLDITAEVMDKLNKAVSQIPLDKASN